MKNLISCWRSTSNSSRLTLERVLLINFWRIRNGRGRRGEGVRVFLRILRGVILLRHILRAMRKEGRGRGFGEIVGVGRLPRIRRLGKVKVCPGRRHGEDV